MKRALLTALLFLVCASAPAQHAFFLPEHQRARFRNRADPRDGSGSCVQASMAEAGCHHGIPQAEYLLHGHPEHGPPVLGGSWPDRVTDYCRARKIPIWNVEGSQTVAWIFWALDRGLHVPISYGHAHMICAVGISDDFQWVYIWDNNFPTEVRKVSRRVFIREHRVFGGGWCVVYQVCGPPPWAIAAPPRRPPRPWWQPFLEPFFSAS